MKKLLILILLLLTSLPQAQSKWWLIDGDTTPPTAPSSPSAVGAVDKITVTWTDPPESDLDSIRIYRGLSTNPTTWVKSIAAGVEAWVDTAHSYGTIYFYRLKGMDNSGNLSDYSTNVNDTVLVNLGSEIVGNVTFDADTWWSKQTGITIADNVCHFSSVGTYQSLYSNCLTSGHTYLVMLEVSNYTEGGVYIDGGGAKISANGTYYRVFTDTDDYLYIATATDVSTTLDIDNVSIKEILNP